MFFVGLQNLPSKEYRSGIWPLPRCQRLDPERVSSLEQL